ncbi:MAG: hypothetical protein JOY68_09630 [Candidatus Dormibacteraeota bacterium]|nr:hypothetical protein [Candidatus Dormibacteraeota bacterium]
MTRFPMRAAAPAVCAVAFLTALCATPVTQVRAAAFDGVPHYQHVGVLVLENESESSTWGASSPATYLNSLVPDGAFAQNYYADGHVSLDNYISMTSGQPGTLTDTDCATVNLYTCQQFVNTAAYMNGENIGDQVEGAELTWREYADSIPYSCFHADLSATASPDPYQGDSTSPPAGNYADRHDPFVYYSDITGNQTRCVDDDVPFTQLATDITGNTVPNYFFITPDTCHDGHDDSPSCATGSPVPAGCTTAGGLVTFDCWLHSMLPSLLTYLDANDGVLFITTDEAADSDTSGCCTGGPGGQAGVGGKVGLLALGYGVRAGYTSTADYDHVSQLRTMEDALGIGTYLNNASTATAMSDLFVTPSTSSPEVPSVLLLPLFGVLAAAVALRRKSRA